MSLLLDTHFVIWLAHNPAEINRREMDAMAQAEAIYVSAATPWELRIKWQLTDSAGRRKGLVNPADAIDLCARSGFRWISLDPDDSCVALTEPPPHRDPFDEMLLVHAQRVGARLLTRDHKLAGHPLAYSV